MEDYKNIKWHPAFYGGMELELREYRSSLSFESEHQLSKEPIRMDLLIVKKNEDIKIENSIASIFRKHNIVEYKSPDDELNLNDLYKVIGYAGIYKGTSTTSQPVEAEELTISLFRYRKPIKLLQELAEMGMNIVEHEKGIYYVEGLIHMPVQIVVIRELEKNTHLPLKILTTDADENEVEEFLELANGLELSEDKTNVEALLQVSIAANQALYRGLRRNFDMNDFLKEFFKEDLMKIAAEESQARIDKMEAEIADKDATIADRDDEIARLKAEIEELKKMQPV